MKKKILTKKNLKSSEYTKTFISHDKAIIEFVAIGMACQALCLLEQANILKILLDVGFFSINNFKKFKNPSLIKAAMFSLMKTNIIWYENKKYFLTDFGRHLVKKNGFITLPFIGYRKLINRQIELLKNPNSFDISEIDFEAIATSSVSFGKKDLNPLLLNVFEEINIRGTICDLGCGTGEKLIEICRNLNLPGLGIERDPKVVNKTRKHLKNFPNISIIKGNIFDLKGIWEDVTAVLISFVLHDITSRTQSEKILKSYKNHFPRMKCLIVVDIVSYSKTKPSIMPGFDYVHGLQGFIPPTYEKNLETFERAGYKILREYEVPNMPNTFIWILQPKR